MSGCSGDRFRSILASFPRQNVKQAFEILKLRTWFSPGEILKMVTFDNAQLLSLSGPRTPFGGKLGTIESFALADLLLVDGDPVENLDLIGDPEKNLKIIMKDDVIIKNTFVTLPASGSAASAFCNQKDHRFAIEVRHPRWGE